MYARAFLEGRLSAQQLENFRRELKPGGGLSSYPHPWLMPDFWEFPTVSMGLGPLMAIYQARFNRYLEDRGLEAGDRRQSLGLPRRWRNRRARIARRHHARFARKARQPHLCHQLQPAAARRPRARQRPDHSGTRIRLSRRALERHKSFLGQRMGSHSRPRHRRPAGQAHGRAGRRRIPEATSSNPAPTSASISSAPIRACCSSSNPYPTTRCAACASAATTRAKSTPRTRPPSTTKARPTVILARTIKGYGLGEAGEGKNVTHQQKKLNEDELRVFRVAFRRPSERRRLRGSTLLSAAREQSRNSISARPPRRIGRLRSQTQRPLQAARSRSRRALQGIHGRQRGPGSFHHHGLRRHAAQNVEGFRNRQIDRAHRSRRSAHLRHGVSVPHRGHLFQRRASATSQST